MQVECVWNVMAHAQKTDLVFRRKVRVHLNRRGRQFSRLLAADVCASAVVMLNTPRSEVVWAYWLPTPFASFPFTSPTRASPCAIRFQAHSNKRRNFKILWRPTNVSGSSICTCRAYRMIMDWGGHVKGRNILKKATRTTRTSWKSQTSDAYFIQPTRCNLYSKTCLKQTPLYTGNLDKTENKFRNGVISHVK